MEDQISTSYQHNAARGGDTTLVILDAAARTAVIPDNKLQQTAAIELAAYTPPWLCNYNVPRATMASLLLPNNNSSHRKPLVEIAMGGDGVRRMALRPFAQTNITSLLV